MEILIVILLIILFIYFALKQKKKDKGLENTFERGYVDFIDNSIELEKHYRKKIKKTIDLKISKTFLTNSSWEIYDENFIPLNILYTFRNNNELLISKNGIVEKTFYEYIIDNNSILIQINNQTEQFDIINSKDNLIFLYRISTSEIFILLNYTKKKDLILKFAKNHAIQEEIEEKKYKYVRIEKLPNHILISDLKYSYPFSDEYIEDSILELEKELNNKYKYKIWKKHNPSLLREDYGDFLLMKKVNLKK